MPDTDACLLPPEIWYTIIGMLHRNDQHTWLSVGRFTRHIALKLVFAVLDIHLGLSDDRKLNAERHADSREYAADERSLMLLERVIHDAKFAAIVRKLVVHANPPGSGVFHLHLLSQALDHLPHLQAFQWTTDYFLGPIIDQLAQTAPDLRELSIVGDGDALCGLDDAFSFRKLAVYAYDSDHIDQCTLYYQSTGSWPPLRSLSYQAPAIFNTPIRVFFALTTLEIDFSIDIWETEVSSADNTLIILRHTDKLEHLALLSIPDTILARFLRGLERGHDGKDLAPTLLSVRFSASLFSTDWYVPPELLASFLRRRPTLRWVDFAVMTSFEKSWLDADDPTDSNDASASYMPPLLDALKKHSALRVLGLDLISLVDLPALAQVLPDQLVALRLGLHDDADSTSMIGGAKGSGMVPLLGRLEKLPRLGLLAINTPNLELPIAHTGHLACDLPAVEVIVLGAHVWDVHRRLTYLENQQSGERAMEEDVTWTRWSAEKVQTRRVEDFGGCAAEEWLMKAYHAFPIEIATAERRAAVQ